MRKFKAMNRKERTPEAGSATDGREIHHRDTEAWRAETGIKKTKKAERLTAKYAEHAKEA